MKKILLLLFLCGTLLLSGCSLLQREYSRTEPHSATYYEGDRRDVLRAESRQDLVNDLLLLVGQHTENAILRLYGYEDDTVVADDLERAASEVQLETPMGAYAVEYITSETQRQRSFYEVSVRVGYRRSLEQIQAVVNATSTAALPDLLNAALMAEKTELAVRIGYWNEDSASRVEQTVEEIREKWDLTETPPWMSRPWVIFSPTGVKATAHAAQSASITTSAPTCPRAADERPPFPRPRLLGLEPLALVSLAASRHRSTPVLGASNLES